MNTIHDDKTQNEWRNAITDYIAKYGISSNTDAQAIQQINKLCGVQLTSKKLDAFIDGKNIHTIISDRKPELKIPEKIPEKTAPVVTEKPIPTPESTVYRLEGVQDILEVYRDKVCITPRGVLGFLNKGMKGTKSIPFSSTPKISTCSFCGKPQTDVKKLIAAPDARICDSCVGVCQRILEKEMGGGLQIFTMSVDNAAKALEVLCDMKKQKVISDAEFQVRARELLQQEEPTP